MRHAVPDRPGTDPHLHTTTILRFANPIPRQSSEIRVFPGTTPTRGSGQTLRIHRPPRQAIRLQKAPLLRRQRLPRRRLLQKPDRSLERLSCPTLRGFSGPLHQRALFLPGFAFLRSLTTLVVRPPRRRADGPCIRRNVFSRPSPPASTAAPAARPAPPSPIPPFCPPHNRPWCTAAHPNAPAIPHSSTIAQLAHTRPLAREVCKARQTTACSSGLISGSDAARSGGVPQSSTSSAISSTSGFGRHGGAAAADAATADAGACPGSSRTGLRPRNCRSVTTLKLAPHPGHASARGETSAAHA